MTFSDKLEKEIQSIINPCHAQLTETVIDKARNGVNVIEYLYYLPSTKDAAGKLLFVSENVREPSGYLLACPEALRGNIPYSNFYQWIRSRVNRLPILAV